LEGVNLFKSPSVRDNFATLTSIVKSPLTKDQKADKKKLEEFERKELLKKSIQVGIDVEQLEFDTSEEGIRLQEEKRTREIDTSVANLESAKQRLANATTTANRLASQKEIDRIEAEAKSKLDPNKEHDVKIANKWLENPEDVSLEQVNDALDIRGITDPTRRKVFTDMAGLNIVTAQDKIDMKIAFDTNVTPEKRKAALVRLGQEDNIAFLEPPQKPTIIEGREQIAVDAGALSGVSSLRGQIAKTSTRNEITDRIISLQESLIAKGSERLTEEEKVSVKEDIVTLQKAIGNIVDTHSAPVVNPETSLDDSLGVTGETTLERILSDE